MEAPLTKPYGSVPLAHVRGTRCPIALCRSQRVYAYYFGDRDDQGPKVYVACADCGHVHKTRFSKRYEDHYREQT